ncbi:MAG: cytochrome C [Thermodesulfobacteriota bacterium]
MQHGRKVFSVVRLAVVAAATAVCFAGTGAAQTEEVHLQPTDCIKCHKQQPAEIAGNGGKHQTEITCLDCHVEHPPWGTDTIPQCSRCHNDETVTHFKLDNCLSCHTNPHMPIASLQLPADAKSQCGTCHADQLATIEQNASKHALQSCVFCHDAHGKIPDCSKCHQPHLAGQTMENCLTCHRDPHKPLDILPPEDTSVAYCGACHTEVAANLGKTKTKHGQLLCVYCHNGQHPTVPKCQQCHGEPHGTEIHQRMPNCVDCHMDPHLLVK